VGILLPYVAMLISRFKDKEIRSIKKKKINVKKKKKKKNRHKEEVDRTRRNR